MSADSDRSSVPAGERVGGYLLDERIGRGGQADVYRAHDPRTGASRALKIVRPTSPSAIARARREGELLSFHPHSGLPRCDAVFQREDGAIVLVLELVEGLPLSELLGSPSLSRAHAEAILDHLIAALAHLHGSDIAHRDVKPENVMITPQLWASPSAAGCVKLVDLGIAKRAGTRKLTRQGAVIGTASYLPPDLLARAPDATETDAEGPRRDLFALGLIAHELLGEGYPPTVSAAAIAGHDLHHELVAFYQRAVQGTVQWPPTAALGRFNTAVRACLAIDPALRPRDAKALLSLTQPQPVQPPRSSSFSPQSIPSGNTPVRQTPDGKVRLSWVLSTLVVAMSALAAVAGATALIGASKKESPSEAPTVAVPTATMPTPTPLLPIAPPTAAAPALATWPCANGRLVSGSTSDVIGPDRDLNICLSGVASGSGKVNEPSVPVDLAVDWKWQLLGTGQAVAAGTDHCVRARSGQSIQVRALGMARRVDLSGTGVNALCVGLKVPLSSNIEARLLFRGP